MDLVWSKITTAFKVFWSYIVALARLVIWTILFFFTGLQRTLFMGCEVASAELKVVPLRHYMEDLDDKISFMDRVCAENPDLMVMSEEEMGFEDEDDDFPFDDGSDTDNKNGDK